MSNVLLCNQNWNSSFFLITGIQYKLSYIHIKCKMKEQNAACDKNMGVGHHGTKDV
jgi:hypothetical protein